MAVHTKFINKSREQIASGDIRTALQYLLFVAKTFELSKAYKRLSLLFSSFEELEIYHSSGTIDPDFAAIQKSRIKQNLLKLADEMEVQLIGQKFDVKVKITGGKVDKKVADWVQSLFM
ncbi:MAG: hypothetical protein Q7T20_04595 [Saprospiraceae bacterium]|nr:hypothetical protein [Saprospiraceae bacterium]